MERETRALARCAKLVRPSLVFRAQRLLAFLGFVITLMAAPEHRIIFDTDFALPPMDDGYALLLALNSPEIEVLGITTVCGNFNRDHNTAQALKMLEITGREEIPVFNGAARPLVHVKSEYAMKRWGRWWSNDKPEAPPGGFANMKAQSESATNFMIQTVMENPGDITIVALGPLTNLAMAMSQEPAFAGNVKGLVIMGGAIATLPDGAGNQTPNAEFNFWVDPEAAHAVLRSGIPVLLSPLNVSRKAVLTKDWYDRIIAPDTPIAKLIKTSTEKRLAEQGEEFETLLMYDQLAVASMIDPTLFETKELYVDVDVNHGINYGVSVAGEERWPGAEGAQRMRVDHDVDFDRFIRMFVERVTR